MDANTVANVIQSIAGGLGTSLIIYITVALRKYLRRHSKEHEFLMEKTEQHGADIKRLLTVLERQNRGRNQR